MLTNDERTYLFSLPRGFRQLRCALLSSFLCLYWCANGFAEEPAFAQSESRSIPEIKWDTTLRLFQFDADKFIGQRLTVQCAPAPAGQVYDGLFGTDYYPSDSSICLAALHAGKITGKGGTVCIQLNPGKTMYSGSNRHGVLSDDFPGTPRSIIFVDDPVSDEATKIQLAHIPRITWDTKFTATGFAHRHLLGQRFTFRCPPAPDDVTPRIVYGTDHYDFASRICLAALHAGKITKQGGICTVQIDPGVPRLVGSIRNGVETKSKGGGDRSISFVEYQAKYDDRTRN